MKYEITKGSEEDFDGGLSGCTHVYDAGAARIWCSGEHSILGSFRLIAERRPITEPVVSQQLIAGWDGEGLPPVGTKCEFKRATGEWEEVEITAIARNGLCFVEPGKKGESYVAFKREFRPIRSPEDVARDAGIKKIMATFKVDGELVPDNVAEAMWDAGYRKME